METNFYKILDMLIRNKDKYGLIKAGKVNIHNMRMYTKPVIRTPVYGGQYIDTVWRFTTDSQHKHSFCEDIRYLMNMNCSLLFEDHTFSCDLKSWNIVPSHDSNLHVDFYIDIKRLSDVKITTNNMISRFDLLDI